MSPAYVYWVNKYEPPDVPESDHASAEDAAIRVHWLNGGNADFHEKRGAK